MSSDKTLELGRVRWIVENLYVGGGDGGGDDDDDDDNDDNGCCCYGCDGGDSHVTVAAGTSARNLKPRRGW